MLMPRLFADCVCRTGV